MFALDRLDKWVYQEKSRSVSINQDQRYGYDPGWQVYLQAGMLKVKATGEELAEKTKDPTRSRRGNLEAVINLALDKWERNEFYVEEDDEASL